MPRSTSVSLRGGSSGSGEPPPLPPPEAPPLEAADSKADEANQPLAEAPAILETEAYRQLEDEFIAVANPEDLRLVDRQLWETCKG